MLILPLFCLVLECARAEGTLSKTVTLSVPNTASTELKMTTSVGGEVGTLVGYSGSMTFKIAYDPLTLDVHEFTFTGGSITATEVNPIQVIQTPITFDNGVTRITTISRQTQPLSYNLTTPITPGTVLPGDGLIESARHRRVAFAGVEVIANNWTGDSKRVVYNSAIPTNLLYRGSSTIHLTEVSTSTLTRTLRATLVHTMDESDTYDIPLSSETVTVTENGDWTMKQTFSAPSEYAYWAQSQGIGTPSPEAKNLAGIAYAFLYAFDLPVTTASLPIRFSDFSGFKFIVVDLPEDGLKLPLDMLYATSLEGPWVPLPEDNRFSGTDALNQGATGNPAFTFPTGPPCFIRLTTVVATPGS